VSCSDAPVADFWNPTGASLQLTGQAYFWHPTGNFVLRV
jgi:hypothetical protein